jgi:hypothetical protein
MKIEFKEKYLLPVLIIAVLFLLLLAMPAERKGEPGFFRWKYSADGENWTPAVIPFSKASDENSSMYFMTAELKILRLPIRELEIFGDDCIRSIEINNKTIFQELDCVSCKHCNGIVLDVNDYLTPGINTIKFNMKDLGGVAGLDVRPSANKWKLLLSAILWSAVALISILFLRSKKSFLEKYYSFFSKYISKELRYVLLLFVSTRVVLTIIGVVSRLMLGKGPSYTNNIFLDIWAVWDSGWYLRIAESGYQSFPITLIKSHMTNFAFFPLYPYLMKFAGFFLHNNYLAGVLISNASLIIGAVYLYKLVNLKEDDVTALRSVKYLFLFPTAFILSGIFAEPLLLAITVACFYYAKKRNWMIVGILGFFSSLTKALGILIFLPICYEYLSSINFKISKIKINAIFLLLIPSGLLLWSVYNFHLTGDFLAFRHAESAWGRDLTNPLQPIISGVTDLSITMKLATYFVIFCFILLIYYYNKIGFSHFLLGFYTIVVPLLSEGIAWSSRVSMPRYILVVFPLYIILAKLAKHKELDAALSIFLALLQGFLMVFWTTQFTLII